MRINNFRNVARLFRLFRRHRLECEWTWNKYCYAHLRRCRFV